MNPEKEIPRVVVDLYMMTSCLKEFHKGFGCVIQEQPHLTDTETALLRSRLMISEVAETVEAISKKDLVEILDGLIDTLYVVVGTAVSYGFGDILNEAFMEVHKNNMSKLGPDGKPLKDASGKIIKPTNYKPVDLKHFLEKI
jgi:predicted HAD superfamily Cof-like phosphohydrolase